METTEYRRQQPETERISPREIELIKYRDNRTFLAIKLINGEEVTGAIRWFDEVAMRLVRPDRTEFTLHLAAIAYYQPSTTASPTRIDIA